MELVYLPTFTIQNQPFMYIGKYTTLILNISQDCESLHHEITI